MNGNSHSLVTTIVLTIVGAIVFSGSKPEAKPQVVTRYYVDQSQIDSLKKQLESTQSANTKLSSDLQDQIKAVNSIRIDNTRLQDENSKYKYTNEENWNLLLETRGELADLKAEVKASRVGEFPVIKGNDGPPRPATAAWVNTSRACANGSCSGGLFGGRFRGRRGR